MSRHIDYDAIDYRNDRLHDKSEEFLNGVIYMAQRIEEAPSIDIVRCKECKHWDDRREDSWWSEDGACLKTSRLGNATYRNADDYCSYGEREGE